MTSMDMMRIISGNLKRVMRETRITQEYLSKRSGVSKGLISKYINCRVIPTVKNLNNICVALGISMDELIDFDDYVD